MATLSNVQVRAIVNIKEAAASVMNNSNINSTRVELARDSLIVSIAKGLFSQEEVNQMSRGIAGPYIQILNICRE